MILTFVLDFQMREVAFASEILTVIEHGKRSPLSVARFTQEKGAASSFYKVVETIETILKSRGMLVTDERKKRMIIKTLNAA
jgi:serine/threonine-protein kinase HSL1, negative regulator of Swe1 kinase